MAITQISREPDYKDLDLDFIAHPTTGDIVRKKGVDALKRSIRNLVLTNFYDRPFRSGIGSNAQKILFDNITPLTHTFLKDAISEVVTNFEPRVRIVEVVVTVASDQNGFNVRLTFIPHNTGRPAEFDMFLTRIR